MIGQWLLWPLWHDCGNSVWLACDWTVTVQVAGVPVVGYCFSWRYWLRPGQQSMECLRQVSCSVVRVFHVGVTCMDFTTTLFYSGFFPDAQPIMSQSVSVVLLQHITCKCPCSRHLRWHQDTFSIWNPYALLTSFSSQAL